MMDNLADIKVKLTCTNSIAAMNIIYMEEQMKYHRATEQRAMDGWMDCAVKMTRRRSFFNRI